MSMIIDGTNGLTFNNATTQASAGSVLQVVNATYSTEVQITTSTWTDIGLTATITPKFATSKILVFVEQCGCAKSNATGLGLRLLRGSTTLITLDTAAGYTNSSSPNYIGSICTSYLDSPATTSATTYKTQQNSLLNVSLSYTQVNSVTSTITLMEIAQ